MTRLSDYTPARVGLGVAGESLPTQPLLDFRLAHARARDAVYFPLDGASLVEDFARHKWSARILHSLAADREEYLRRPERGRQLSSASAGEVAKYRRDHSIAIVVADGLSALAVHRHAVPLLESVLARLEFSPSEEQPLWIVQQGRVAIGDPLGELLGADLSIVIIGERPGLSTPDSLGIYLTWAPRVGRTDAERNCISNIHAHGLTYELAAHKLHFLVSEARRRRLSGVALKEVAGGLVEG